MDYCPQCGAKLIDANVEQMHKELTPEQLRQLQPETIWFHEKTVPKWMRGTWQGSLSLLLQKLEHVLTENEKQYPRRKRY